MNAVIQFDLFEAIPTKEEMMQADIKAIAISSDKVSKKLFSENSALKKRMLEIEYRLEVIERNICHG
jgi:hypothetical protein